MEYYASLVQEQLIYRPVTLTIREIRLETVPVLNGGQSSKLALIKYKLWNFIPINAFYLINILCF